MTAKSPIQWPGTSRDGHAGKRLPQPLYGVLVVTLTVFLAGLVAGRPAVEGYLVGAELAIETHTPTEVSKPPEVIPASRSPGDVLADVPWQSRVGTAVRRADARMSASEEGVDRPEHHGRTAEVARHVHVIADSLTDGPPRLRVFYRGVDPVWSLALVQELTQSLLDESTETARENRQLDASIAHAQWRVDQHRHYARNAQFDLETVGDGEALAMLRSDAAHAQVQCEQSEAVLHGLLAARAKELDERRVPRRWLTMPAQITHRFGGNLSRDRVAVIGLLAVCCGAGAAWQIARVRSDCGRIEPAAGRVGWGGDRNEDRSVPRSPVRIGSSNPHDSMDHDRLRMDVGGDRRRVLPGRDR